MSVSVFPMSSTTRADATAEWALGAVGSASAAQEPAQAGPRSDLLGQSERGRGDGRRSGIVGDVEEISRAVIRIDLDVGS